MLIVIEWEKGSFGGNWLLSQATLKGLGCFVEISTLLDFPPRE